MGRAFMVLGLVFLGALGTSGCDETHRGVGAECARDTDCTGAGQVCLLAFQGGYCGAVCVQDANCPKSSACVVASDGVSYCFRTCTQDSQCNGDRTVDNVSICTASVTFVDPTMDRQACLPPPLTPPDGGAD